jgi:hypothetical protein
MKKTQKCNWLKNSEYFNPVILLNQKYTPANIEKIAPILNNNIILLIFNL